MKKIILVVCGIFMCASTLQGMQPRILLGKRKEPAELSVPEELSKEQLGKRICLSHSQQASTVEVTMNDAELLSEDDAEPSDSQSTEKLPSKAIVSDYYDEETLVVYRPVNNIGTNKITHPIQDSQPEYIYAMGVNTYLRLTWPEKKD